MQSGWGRIFLVLVGLVVIGIGGYHVYKGVSKRFEKDLKVSPGRGITVLGIGGYTAKGLVFVGAGILVLVATLRFDPSKATGIDGAVKALGAAPFGKFLLIARRARASRPSARTASFAPATRGCDRALTCTSYVSGTFPPRCGRRIRCAPRPRTEVSGC